MGFKLKAIIGAGIAVAILMLTLAAHRTQRGIGTQTDISQPLFTVVAAAYLSGLDSRLAGTNRSIADEIREIRVSVSELLAELREMDDAHRFMTDLYFDSLDQSLLFNGHGWSEVRAEVDSVIADLWRASRYEGRRAILMAIPYDRHSAGRSDEWRKIRTEADSKASLNGRLVGGRRRHITSVSLAVFLNVLDARLSVLDAKYSSDLHAIRLDLSDGPRAAFEKNDPTLAARLLQELDSRLRVLHNHIDAEMREIRSVLAELLPPPPPPPAVIQLPSRPPPD